MTAFIIAATLQEAMSVDKSASYVNSFKDLAGVKEVMLVKGYDRRHDWDTLYNIIVMRNIKVLICGRM